MTKQFIYLIGALLCIAACKNDDATMISKNTKKTANGYSYEMLNETGGVKAKVGDNVFYQVEIKAKDSTIYNTAQSGRPQQFTLLPEEQLKGSTNPMLDLFPLMATGDQGLIYFPMDSLKQRPSGFDDEEFLKYIVTMKHISKKELQGGRDRVKEVNDLVQKTHADYKLGKLDDKLIKLDSGLKMFIHEQGNGAEPKKGEFVDIHYYGVLVEGGAMFDNSFKTDRPFVTDIGVGSVIRGWDEGITQMKKGTKASLFIPSNLGYGSRGSGTIPADSELMFYVELFN